MNEDIAALIVFNIVEDIEDRRGLKQEWEQIDDDIQIEIKDEWVRIIGEVTGAF